MTEARVGLGPAWEYWTDDMQRVVLFMDTLRERGNIYREHRHRGVGV
jgi:hypothetical protein